MIILNCLSFGTGLRVIQANMPILFLFDKTNVIIYIIGFSVPFDINMTRGM